MADGNILTDFGINLLEEEIVWAGYSDVQKSIAGVAP